MDLTKLLTLNELLDSEVIININKISGKLFSQKIKQIKKFFNLPRIYNQKSGQELKEKINQYLRVHNKQIVDQQQQELMFIILNEFYNFSTLHGTYSITDLSAYHNQFVKQVKQKLINDNKNDLKNSIDIQNAINKILNYVDNHYDADEDDYYATANCLNIIKNNCAFEQGKEDKFDKILIEQIMTFLTTVNSSSLIDLITTKAIESFNNYHIIKVKDSLFIKIKDGIKKYSFYPEKELSKLLNAKKHFMNN